MKSFFDKTEKKLTIRVSIEFQHIIKMTLFDAHFNAIETGYWNNTNFQLRQGLYLLRLDLNGKIKDKNILLNNDLVIHVGNYEDKNGREEIFIKPPKQYSSALLLGNYESSYDYYFEPAQRWSSQSTFRGDQHSVTNSSLFIFLRYPSKEIYNSLNRPSSQFNDFKIVDEDGELVCDFKNSGGTKMDEENGWLAFSGLFEKGVYYLIYSGIDSRQIPIHVFSSWNTQFFLTLNTRPIYSSIRIFLSKDRYFNPYKESNRYIDVFLNKLENKNFILEDNLIRYAASEKFEQPILGILCAYIYLNNSQGKDDKIIRSMIQNIQRLILVDNEDSPDIRALNILASRYFKNFKYKKSKVKGTPMFRVGFEAILESSVKDSRLITQNSINDLISENLRFDSPFNTFKPVNFKKRKRVKQVGSTGSKQIEERAFKKLGLSIPVDQIDSGENPIRQIYPAAIFDRLQEDDSTFSDNSWIKNSMKNIIRDKEDITVSDLSNELHISQSTVRRIMNEWKKKSK